MLGRPTCQARQNWVRENRNLRPREIGSLVGELIPLHKYHLKIEPLRRALSKKRSSPPPRSLSARKSFRRCDSLKNKLCIRTWVRGDSVVHNRDSAKLGELRVKKYWLILRVEFWIECLQISALDLNPVWLAGFHVRNPQISSSSRLWPVAKPFSKIGF